MAQPAPRTIPTIEEKIGIPPGNIKSTQTPTVVTPVYPPMPKTQKTKRKNETNPPAS